MNKALDRRVRSRAGLACEYCKLPQSAYTFRFPLDHIIAQQHGGATKENDLALACTRCNGFKGPNLAGIDPLTKELVRLFHPRRDTWNDHFRWHGPRLIGRTAIGRATICVLAINHPDVVRVRRSLIAEGAFPPS
jgi:hypothetical protein